MLKRDWMQPLRWLMLASLVALIAGCASPAAREAMVVKTVGDGSRSSGTVSVTTQGGQDTGAMDSSNISDEDFAKAIEESIVGSGLFADVVHGKAANYRLTVSIIELTKPMFGASFTVTMEAAWVLIKADSGEALLKKSVRSSYTATMGAAFAGVTRLRLAVEGAAKENIRLGLQEIASLKLP